MLLSACMQLCCLWRMHDLCDTQLCTILALVRCVSIIKGFLTHAVFHRDRKPRSCARRQSRLRLILLRRRRSSLWRYAHSCCLLLLLLENHDRSCILPVSSSSQDDEVARVLTAGKGNSCPC